MVQLPFKTRNLVINSLIVIVIDLQKQIDNLSNAKILLDQSSK